MAAGTASSAGMKRILILASLALIIPLQAAADEEGPKRMKSEYCFGTQGYLKQLSKFDELKPERRDTVAPVLEMVFAMEEGEAATQRAELRQGERVVPVPLTQVGDIVRSGNLAALLRERRADIEGDGESLRLCVVDPAREGRLWSDPGYDLRPGFNVRFIDTDGMHDLATLEDGLKDGRRHWKKMAGAMGFMVPKFDHIAVASDDRDNPPAVTALKDGAAIAKLEGDFYDGARMVALDALEDMGADAIRVEAEYYRLTPSPDAKTVARFSGGGSDDGDDK